MSKLIYSPTATLIEGTYNGIKNIDQAANPVFFSVAFTGDGYLYTHGRKFRLFSVTDNVVEGLSFSILNGTAGFYIDGASVGTGTVIQQINGDGIIEASTSNGITNLSHATTLTASQIQGTYGSTTQIPIIQVDACGHITYISNSTTIDVSQLRAESTTTTGYYYPIGVTDNTLQNPVYHSNLFFDGAGNIYANNIFIGANALSTLFAPISHTSVYADDSTYGHVQLSDNANGDQDVNSHIAATPKAVSSGIAAANQYSEDLFAAQDAMVFCGTLKADGTITSHNPTILPSVIDNASNITYLDYKVGWTFRFVQGGTFNGEDIEVGDMLIAVHKKDQDFNINDWTVIQTNISGALTASQNLNGLLYANNSRVVNSLALSSGILKFDGTTLSFVNPNTTWRDVQVDSTSIGTTKLNLISGNAITISNNEGDVTIAVNSANIIQTSASLTLEKDLTKFVYKPSAAANLLIGNHLSLYKNQEDKYVLDHAAGTVFTNKLGSITTDAYGHVVAINEIDAISNPYNLVIKVNSDNLLQYSGGAEEVLIFSNGTDISFTTSSGQNGESIITPEITHKYRSVQFYPTLQSQEAVPLLANNVNNILTLIGGDNVSLSNVNSLGEDLPTGTLMINAEDTWRNVEAFRFQSNVLSRVSIGSNQLNFGDDFLMSNNELGITWTEIDEDGRVTYVK